MPMLLLSLLACEGEDAPKKFDAFEYVFQPALSANAKGLGSRPDRLQVLVYPERQGQCRKLPTLRAEVDGVALTRLHGVFDDGVYRYDRDCFVYEFEIDVAALGPAAAKPSLTVQVTDGETTLALTARNLLAESRATVRTEAPKAGGEVVLALEPADDTIDPKAGVDVRLTPAEGAPVRVPAKATPDTLTFTVPEGMSGPVDVDVMGTRAWMPPVTECVRAHVCTASRDFVYPTVRLEVR